MQLASIPPPVGPPIDASRLDEASGGDPEFVAEILDLYVGDAEMNLTNLLAAVGASKVDQIISLSHVIKGSSANVGATTMQALANKMEAMARVGDLSKMDGLAKRLIVELERVRTYCRS